ncbi:MAG: hypothetical protein ACYCYF_04425 [Anaerolineae bacterium]
MSGEWTSDDLAGQRWAERAQAQRRDGRRVRDLEHRLAKAEGELRRVGETLIMVEQTAASLETETAVYSERLA